MLMLAAALTLGQVGCKRRAKGQLVGVAIDVGGRGDQSFNDGALRGAENMAAGLRHTPRGYLKLSPDEYLQLLPQDLRASPPPHLALPSPLVVAGKAQEDYEPNLQLLVDEGAQLVVAVGFLMEPAVRAVSELNPQSRFLLIDSPLLDATGKPTRADNVRAVIFKEQEGSFLAGALAAKVSRTGKLGFVGGIQIPLIRKFEVGFRAGAQTVDPKATVFVSYTGSFDSESNGAQAGQDLYARGCDVVFQAAGLDGLGVIKAAQEAGKLVIGVDSDQGHVAPHNVLTSMVKHVDLAVYQGISDALSGKFTGGTVVLGVKEGGVGLAPLGGDADPAITPAAIRAAGREIEPLRDALVSGALTVPATLEELAAFHPPAQGKRAAGAAAAAR